MVSKDDLEDKSGGVKNDSPFTLLDHSGKPSDGMPALTLPNANASDNSNDIERQKRLQRINERMRKSASVRVKAKRESHKEETKKKQYRNHSPPIQCLLPVSARMSPLLQQLSRMIS